MRGDEKINPTKLPTDKSMTQANQRSKRPPQRPYSWTYVDPSVKLLCEKNPPMHVIQMIKKNRGLPTASKHAILFYVE